LLERSATVNRNRLKQQIFFQQQHSTL